MAIAGVGGLLVGVLGASLVLMSRRKKRKAGTEA